MNILDLIFPKTCLGCKKLGSYICADCEKKVNRFKLTCPTCEKPAVDGMTHVKCKKAWGLSGLLSIWGYRGVIRKAILGLKYKFALEISEELADNIVKVIKKENIALPLNCIFVPIPLHKYRKNWRGFNQVEEIGKLVAKKMNWKFVPDLLIRKHSRRPQSELKGDERRKNVRGVFSLNPDVRRLKTNDRCLILFDDVYTTGSTIKEACKVFKRKGVKKVWGLTIAR